MQLAIEQLQQELKQVHARLGGLFKRSEPRQRCLDYLQGLLSGVPRKNGWQLAQWMGEATPDGVQHLLERAHWSADAARDVLREYVVEQLGDKEAVLIVDETGFIKKGRHSAGVQRQYSGTAGRIENSQIGVFLCYAGKGASAFMDRALYLPRQWSEDRARCEAAGIGQEVQFATKPELARAMLERALDAGVPCGWVTGDAVYGGDRRLRRWLEEREQAFVLAVACDEPLWWGGPQYRRADQIAQEASAWQRLSGTYVENLPWLECAERYDRSHTFHYMDPPYWQTAGYGVDFPFENYERMADFMRRCKGKVMVSINYHPDIRRVFKGFHFETTEIRYTTTNQRQGKAEVTGELIVMNWEPEAWGGLF